MRGYTFGKPMYPRIICHVFFLGSVAVSNLKRSIGSCGPCMIISQRFPSGSKIPCLLIVVNIVSSTALRRLRDEWEPSGRRRIARCSARPQRPSAPLERAASYKRPPSNGNGRPLSQWFVQLLGLIIWIAFCLLNINKWDNCEVLFSLQPPD